MSKAKAMGISAVAASTLLIGGLFFGSTIVGAQTPPSTTPTPEQTQPATPSTPDSTDPGQRTPGTRPEGKADCPQDGTSDGSGTAPSGAGTRGGTPRGSGGDGFRY
jgi:hypothetical protein